MSPVLLQNRDWLIEPDALRAMAASAEEARGRDASSLSKPGNPLLQIEEGIGTVAIEGPILRKPDLFARIFMGATDSEEVGTALREAAGRDDVRAVFLDIDSPGGTVAGTPELAAAVSALNEKKPVYAFSSGLMCSAAYWIASQARAIYATPSARVGSIGVVQTVIDDSARLHAAGIKVEVFAVGKYKAMGAPGTPLSEDQRELIRSNLAETAADFHAAVLSKGREIPSEAMEGQTFSGRQARQFNLADIVHDRAEAMRRLRIYHAAVDTGAGAMSTALEDQLAEARSQIESLQSDNQAQADLLTEASTTQEQLRGEVEALSAQTESLTTLLAKFPILARIATDFSASSVKYNQDIVTHIVTPTVARDFDQATGYVPDDQAQVDVPVKINKHAYAGYAITDVERSTSQIDLNQRYADKVAYALGRKVCDDLMALIVTANFPNESEVAEVDFKRNSVVDIGTKLNKRFIPDMGRFMFLNSDFYNALQKDEALYKAYITPAASNVVVSGVLPDVNGFTVIEYSALPENAENLVGFAGIREGLIMAARVPDVPQNTGDTVIRVVTDPRTGLSVQVRDRYDGRLGKQEVSFTLMYGFATGNAPVLERIVKPAV